MKQSIILTFVTVIFSLQAFAQTAASSSANIVSIQEGPDYKSKNTLVDILAVDEDNFFVLTKKVAKIAVAWASPKYSIGRLSSDMELQLETKLEPTFEGNDLDYERILMQNGKLYLFSSYLNRDQKKVYAFYQTLDQKTLQPNSDLTKIAEISGNTNKELKKTGYSIRRSPDQSKVLVYYDLPYEKEDRERYGLHVFDNEMKVLWSKEIELPYTDELFAVSSKAIADNGEVFVMGALHESPKRNSGYDYKIFSVTENGAVLDEYDIDLDGRSVNNLAMRLNDNNEILCGGFYGIIGAVGSFFVKIDRESKEIVQKSFVPFDERFIMEDMRKKEKKKAERRVEKGKVITIDDLQLDRLVLREDGGAIIVGERRWVETRTVTSQNGGTRTYYVYHNHDLVLVSIGPDGQIDWNARIPKYQAFKNTDMWSSYLMAVVGSKLYFVFNDNPKNMFYNGDGKLAPMNLKKNFVAMVEVDSDGNVFRKSLIDDGKGKQPIVKPLVSEQIDGQNIYLYSERGKKKQFMKLKFKNPS